MACTALSCRARTRSNQRNSTPLTITIDTTPPNSTFVTRNGTYFPSGTFNITIRINDTLDRDINYSIFINETRNATGNLTNATNTNVTIDGLARILFPDY